VVGAVRYPTGDFRFAHQPKSVTTALLLAVLEMLLGPVSRNTPRDYRRLRAFRPASRFFIGSRRLRGRFEYPSLK